MDALTGPEGPDRLPRQALAGVAQSVEHLVVVQDVAGSSPVSRPLTEERTCRIGRHSADDGVDSHSCIRCEAN